MYDSKRKNQSLSKLVLMAGAEGLEPSTKVLETHVLPLHHAPMHIVCNKKKYSTAGSVCQAPADIFLPRQRRRGGIFATGAGEGFTKRDGYGTIMVKSFGVVKA